MQSKPNILKTQSTTKIERIYHTGDLHIRLLKRHDEYRDVLEKFLADVARDKSDGKAIVVTGDVLHSKTELTPECVQLARWFFTSAAKICPTFVICGAHDINLTNKARLDSLTPILSDVENVHYFSTGGNYQYNNVLFSATTIRDKQIVKPPTDTDRTKICLMYTATLTEPDFGSEFDIVMLGGSHMGGMLSSNIGYSSSLIQQGHNEPLEGHGYLIWNIATCTAEFVQVDNEYGYHTIAIKGGEIEPVDLSTKPRIRFEITDTDPKIAKQVITDFCVGRNVQETVVFTHKSTSSQGSVDKIKTNMTLADPQLLLAQIAPADKLPEVLTLHNHYQSFLDSAQVSSETKLWRLKTLEFSNMFCYTGAPTAIDFSDYKGLVGIFGANHSGKSSIIDVILYCLYDKCSRGERKEVLNYGKTEFSCSLTFELDSKLYRVVRVGKLNKITKVLKVDVELWVDTANMTGKDRYETNQRIVNLIGTYDDLTVSAIALQGMTNSFMDMTQSNRKKLLNDLMRLNNYEKLHELANTDLKEVNAELKVLEKSYHPDKVKAVTTNITTLEAQLVTDTQQLLETQQKIDETQKEKETLLKQLAVDIPECDMTAEEINAEISGIDAELANQPTDIDSQIEGIEFEIADAENSYREFLEDYNTNLLELKSKQNKLQRDLRRVESTQYDVETLEQWKEKLESSASPEFIAKEVQFLDDLAGRLAVFGDDDIIEIGSLVTARKQMIFSSRGSKIPLTMSQIVSHLKCHENNLESLEHNSRIEKDITAVNAQIKLLQRPSDPTIPLKRELTALKKLVASAIDLKERKEDLVDCLKYHEQISKNEQLNTQIKRIDAQLSGYKLKHKKLQTTVNGVSSDIKVARIELEKLTATEQNIKSLKQEQEGLKLYTSCVHKDGIPHLILKEAVPFLEHKANEIISLLTDFKLEIVTDGKDIDLLVSREPGSSHNVQMASGFEKFVCSVAIRVGMLSLSMLPKPNFIMIDEGFGAFDADNLGSVNLLLEYLRAEFETVIIISHIDLLKNDIDHIIVPEDMKKKPKKDSECAAAAVVKPAKVVKVAKTVINLKKK